MILRFSFANHRSFSDQQELSLIATALKDSPEAARSVEALDERVLCVAAIYGANASGKTNVLRALRFMRWAVRESQRSWKPEGPIKTQPFLLEPSQRTAASRYELDLILRGVRFRYGFELDSEQVRSEWLYSYPSGRRQLWFERDSASPRMRFGKHLVGENRTIEKLTRRNSLFLSAAAQNNHDLLTPLHTWFSDHLEMIGESRHDLVRLTSQQCESEKAREAIFQFLKAADLGIVSLEMSEEDIPTEVKALLDKMNSLPQVKVELNDRVWSSSQESWLSPSLRHRAKAVPEGVSFRFDDESAGTLALFALLGPVLKTLEAGGLLMIDELDASLHPLLAIELVRLFNDPKRNPERAQLVFNTHDTNLLDPSLLRRDQVWFVEKDVNGASHLYPLTDFKPRKLENLERGYLQGRYGAVPFVGSLQLIEPSEVN